jgi:predicted TIM-barrel fold metal-dependent hydrolase
MNATSRSVIDCDLHPGVPGMQVLLPYMDDYWRDQFVLRAIDNLEMASYPLNAPLTCRPDWRPAEGKPGTDLGLLRSQALETFNTRYAICNPLWGGQVAFSETMGAAICGAINSWIAKEWLDAEPRLRSSIVVAQQAPEQAAEEIERRAADKRFVQVLLLAGSEMLLGRRYYWPIYEAAVRHNLPICIHAGSMYRHPTTPNGWPSHYIQDYASNTHVFAAQLQSLMSEGVFAKFPEIRFVLAESGVSWLPGYLWRASKTWKGIRGEVPWIKVPPAEIVRHHVRLTVQPFDVPAAGPQVEKLVEQLGSDDMLLFSTDYPHWQFDGTQALPHGLSPRLVEKITLENPLRTYPNLKETVQ